MYLAREDAPSTILKPGVDPRKGLQLVVVYQALHQLLQEQRRRHHSFNMRITALFSLLPLAFAAPANVEKRAGPTVVAPSPQATVLGKSALNVESFNAIPYAQPPVGQLRLKPPQPLTSSLGTIDGTGSARACPQFFFSVDAAAFPTNVIGTILNTPLFQAISNAGEDCLTINVQRPAGTKADAKLPVLFWIFGGGFELGG